MSLHDRRQVPLRLFEAYLFVGKVTVVEACQKVTWSYHVIGVYDAVEHEHEPFSAHCYLIATEFAGRSC
jgi:hypothetical protein